MGIPQCFWVSWKPGNSVISHPAVFSITGGQLGLWVGISAISVCELFDLIAQLIVYMWPRQDGRKVEDEPVGKQQAGVRQVQPMPIVT